MNKPVITREQAEKIRGWQAHTSYPNILLELHVNNALVCNNCLQSLTLDELARAIYVGYEVEVEVGDFAVSVHDGTVLEVINKITESGTYYEVVRCSSGLKESIHRDRLRHATESEIVEEKERRMDSKLDKILLDSSYTLNQEQAYKDLQEEKRLVEEECERYKKMFSEEKGKTIALYNQNKRYEQALEFGIKYLQGSDIGQVQIVVQAMKEALGESE